MIINKEYINIFKLNKFLLVSFFALAFFIATFSAPEVAQAAARTASVSGNWNNTATWPWGATAKVIILTNVSDPNKMLEGMETLDGVPYEYLIKSDWSLEAIVKRIKERLTTN